MRHLCSRRPTESCDPLGWGELPGRAPQEIMLTLRPRGGCGGRGQERSGRGRSPGKGAGLPRRRPLLHHPQLHSSFKGLTSRPGADTMPTLLITPWPGAQLEEPEKEALSPLMGRRVCSVIRSWPFSSGPHGLEWIAQAEPIFFFLIYLCWVLVSACRIFVTVWGLLLWHTGSVVA